MNDTKLDRLLDGITALVEMVFPERVQAYYLTGSYAEDTAVRHQLHTVIQKTPGFENLILKRCKISANYLEI